jgi:hypothetical protein
MGRELTHFQYSSKALGYHKGDFLHSLLLSVHSYQGLQSPVYFELNSDVKKNLQRHCRADSKDISSGRKSCNQGKGPKKVECQNSGEIQKGEEKRMG